MKKKRDQLTAFLLSALLLITGSAVGTTSAWADEKSPPSNIARCEQAGISKGFAITFNAEVQRYFVRKGCRHGVQEGDQLLGFR